MTLPPRLGFGTWQLAGADCEEGVAHALALGYRHIDTARIYDNEVEVGRAVAASGLPRGEVFLTTKVWRSDLGRAREALQESLERLDTPYVDLTLIHWPDPTLPFEPALDALFQARADGLTRHVGVSNFPPGLLRRALARGPIAANQVEAHPFLDQSTLRALCRERGVALTAYSPLARGAVVRDPTLQALGAELGVSPAVVSLAWLLGQEGVGVLPGSRSARHREANLAALTLRLSPAQRARVDALARPDGRLTNPPWAPDWGG